MFTFFDVDNNVVYLAGKVIHHDYMNIGEKLDNNDADNTDIT